MSDRSHPIQTFGRATHVSVSATLFAFDLGARIMVRAFAFLALAGLSTQSHAGLLGLDMVVSSASRANWSDSLVVPPGSIVVVGAFTRHGARDFGLDVAVLGPTTEGGARGDFAAIDGTDCRIAPINGGDAGQPVFVAAGALRIGSAGDAASSAAGGVGIAQGDAAPGTSHTAGSQSPGFLSSVALDAGGANRDLNRLVDQVKAGVMTPHSAAGPTGGHGSNN